MTKRFGIILDDLSVSRMEELAQHFNTLNAKGEMNFTNTLKAIVGFSYEKKFPQYVQIVKSRPTIKEKEAIRADIIDQREKQKEEKVNARLEGICMLMDEAEIIAHPDTGRPACRYPVFTTASPHQVEKTWYTEELSLLNDETPSLQYHGLFNETGEAGKQDVLARIKKNKIKF